ncbi:MAG: hypothetical protein J1G02_05895 [Clostridiales bacterium]|nr:hypothetical protein [Clostridiales bacterium]
MIVYDKKVYDVSVVGGKAYGLFKLASYGYNVPDFFVITVGTDLGDKLFAAELDAYAAKLHCELFAVRSSNVNEDGGVNSFAGQFDTELNVERDALYQAVMKVAASSSNRQTTAYNAHVDAHTCDMAIVVQAQINPTYAGVMFTTSPFSNGHVLIEQVDGLGEQLVSGSVIPRKTQLAKGENNSTFYGELARAAECLEKLEGYPLDVEWAYKDKLYFLQMRPLTALDDPLPAVPSSDWSLYVYRDFCLFSQSVQAKASEPQLQTELFGFSVPIVEGLLVNGREFYTSRNDLACINLWKSLDGGSFFEDFIDKLNKSVSKTKRLTSQLRRTDYSQVKDRTLFNAYNKYITAYIKSYVPLMIRPDDYLHSQLQQLLGKEQADSAISCVTALARNTYYASEQVDFLIAVINGNSAKYLSEYEWIYNPLGKKLNPMTLTNFDDRSKRWTTYDAIKRWKQITLQQDEDKRQARRFMSKVSNDETKRLLKLIVQFVGLRTYTAENSDRFFFYIRSKILSQIARRFNLAEERLMLMTFEEVMNLEQGVPSRNELAKRSRGSMTVFTNGVHTTYYGGQTYGVLTDLLPTPEFDEGTVRGEIACRGEITARVRIINNFDETDKLNEGEIIVTSMTTPELTVALEKAVGIITDEGGVTCHAAIISREYGIPCLVGTQVATHVLQDGMLVKLDCIQGYFQVVED